MNGFRKSVQLPAGTTFLDVIWDPEYWPLVKSGRVKGYSMGGRAFRVREAGQAERVDVEKDPLHKARGSLLRRVVRDGGVVLR